MEFVFNSIEIFEKEFIEKTIVPPRNENRKNIHRELYCLFKYLKCRIKSNEIVFPFSIEKSESPDFILIDENGNSEGIEISEITTEEYQRKLSKDTKSNAPFRFELSQSYLGDSVEEEWATISERIIYDKLNKLNSKFKKYQKNNLVLYSNTDLPSIDYQKGKEKLINKLNYRIKSTDWNYSFNTICVMNSVDVYQNFLISSADIE